MAFANEYTTLDDFLESKDYQAARGFKIKFFSEGLLTALHDTKMGRIDDPGYAGH
jgi:hypothetical protein